MNEEFLNKHFPEFDINVVYELYSKYLATNYSKDFDQWWDPEKFDWDKSLWLCDDCSNKFDIWFDPEKFNWNDGWGLAYFCSDKFNQWWDTDKFKYKDIWAFRDTCAKYKYIWEPYLILNGI